MNSYLESRQEEFQKAVDFFKSEISKIRAGRANSAILDGVFVEAYGTRMPVQGVANINVQDSKNILVEPWDKSVLKEVEKAISEAQLGLNINDDGNKIRLTLPETTEETRKELTKKLNEKLEQARISIRQIREEIKKDIEEAEKNKEITEDDRYDFIEELDKEVEKINNQLKETRDKKEEDIMTV
ncbi:MAG TPA: ribosome recycling factor [Patescibacteria group bacterium]|nr:ribosome recycling factor [Patescibacteria group bacterium]